MTAHSDRTSILSAYSREMGRVSFAVASGSGAGAARRRALLMPLNPVEVVASIRGGRELMTFREPRALMPLHGIMASPERSAVLMFMAEVLERVLRQSEAEPRIFDFVMETVGRLNSEEARAANFHLCFMIQLAALLGIAPDGDDYRDGMIFDMTDGVFRLSKPLRGRALSASDSRIAATFLRMTWENQAAFRLDRTRRNEVLEKILEYYSLHLADLTSLRSPAILHSIF